MAQQHTIAQTAEIYRNSTQRVNLGDTGERIRLIECHWLCQCRFTHVATYHWHSQWHTLSNQFAPGAFNLSK